MLILAHLSWQDNPKLYIILCQNEDREVIWPEGSSGAADEPRRVWNFEG